MIFLLLNHLEQDLWQRKPQMAQGMTFFKEDQVREVSATNTSYIALHAHLHSPTDYLVSNYKVIWRKFMRPKVECHDWWENPDHSFITERIDGADIEMSNKTRSDCIPSTTWRTHGCYQFYVNQCDFTGVLKVIPRKHTQRQREKR